MPPPPVTRYGLTTSYPHLQQAHLQQQHQQQSQHHHPAHAAAAAAAAAAATGIPPPSLGGHPGFTAGNPSAAAAAAANINPFTLSGAGIANGMSVPGFATGNVAAAGGGAAGIGAAGTAADSGGTGLASHAAQMGFARGAQMQQQQLHQTHDGRLTLETKSGGAVKSRIRDVWRHNLAQEMATLRQLIEKYPYISMVSMI